MKSSNRIDENMLAAFVDGQLDVEKSELVIQAMDKDETVRESVYRLRRAKDLMKLGFADALPPEMDSIGSELRQRKLNPLYVAASVLILVASFSFGFFGYMAGKQLGSNSDSVLVSDTQTNPVHVVLHIDKSDMKQFDAVLTYTNSFLGKYGEQGGQIAIVANASGLDLLRAGVSPYEKKIYAMIRNHDNVQFIACANAIHSLRQKGVEPLFHAGIDTDKPALDQIVARVQDGWSYVKAGSLI